MTDFQVMLTVLTAGNLILSVVSGLCGGLYMAIVHPTSSPRVAIFRSVELGAIGTILYVARIAFALAGDQPDIGRVAGGLALWLLFCGFLGLVAWLASKRRRASVLGGEVA